MSDKTFRNVLIITLVICVLCTALMVGYTAYLHGNCSIIGYIANER